MKKLLVKTSALLFVTAGFAVSALPIAAGGKKCHSDGGDHVVVFGCEGANACAPFSPDKTCTYARWAKGLYCADSQTGVTTCQDSSTGVPTRQTQVYRSYSECVIIGMLSSSYGTCVCSDSQRGPEQAPPGDTKSQGQCQSSG